MTAAMTDGDLAAHLAEAAGAVLRAIRASGAPSDDALAGDALGKAGDAAANRLIVDALRHQRPDDGLLSEEERDDSERLAKSRVWIVDPVDGTREYAEITDGRARTDWAVHVALAIDGVAAVGAVALPGRGLLLRSDQPGVVPPPPARLRMLVSRTRPSAVAVAVANALDADIIAMGSAGAKAMAVVLGDADMYLHTGGQYEWDSCAPVAVALAYGLHCSRIDGTPLSYNNRDTYVPDLLICRPQHAATVLGEVRTWQTASSF